MILLVNSKRNAVSVELRRKEPWKIQTTHVVAVLDVKLNGHTGDSGFWLFLLNWPKRHFLHWNNISNFMRFILINNEHLIWTRFETRTTNIYWADCNKTKVNNVVYGRCACLNRSVLLRFELFSDFVGGLQQFQPLRHRQSDAFFGGQGFAVFFIKVTQVDVRFSFVRPDAGAFFLVQLPIFVAVFIRCRRRRCCSWRIGFCFLCRGTLERRMKTDEVRVEQFNIINKLLTSSGPESLSDDDDDDASRFITTFGMFFLVCNRLVNM